MKIKNINYNEMLDIERNMMEKLQPYLERVYIELNIIPIPIVFKNIPEDSRFTFPEKYVIVSTRYLNDFIEVLKCVIHELRHYYQYELISVNNKLSLLEQEWKKEFQNLLMPTSYSVEDISDLSWQFIEIDAYAYTQLKLQDYLGIYTAHPNELFQLIIEGYLDKYL